MKLKYLIAALVLLIPQIVFAAPNATMSTNASSIENGKSITATVALTDTAAWNIKIVGSGAATCSSKQADVTPDGKSTTKKFTLDCKSTTEGTITFKVTGDITSGSGETKDISLTKTVTVTKAKSSTNTLDDLKVDEVSISGFTSSKTSYTINDSSLSSINISATLTDSKATVSGTGNKTLKYGKNTFNIVVTAENGSKKTYTIIVNKTDTRNNNNYLKSLTIDPVTIDFNKNITSYSVKVEHNINEINISASAEDEKSSISGTGKKTLKDYGNEFKVIVTAENGSKKTYIINVVRKDTTGNYGKLNADNSVKSISVKEFDFKFNNDTKKYNILVDENIDNIEFSVIPNDSKATVSVTNNTNLKAGLNVVNVKVKAENGDSNEFIFNVYKLGEESQKEAIATNDEPSENENIAKKDSINIWMIISLIEFLIIIVLLMKKNKKTNKSQNVNNQLSNNETVMMGSSITNIDDKQENINNNYLN